jgi:DNA-binding transcriptional ArsR family regulator
MATSTKPAPGAVALEDVLAALSDPVRLRIVRTLAVSDEGRACGTFDLPVTKSTASHHFRVLREAGVIDQEERGRTRHNTLRRAELEERFPGLIALILHDA